MVYWALFFIVLNKESVLPQIFSCGGVSLVEHHDIRKIFKSAQRKKVLIIVQQNDWRQLLNKVRFLSMLSKYEYVIWISSIKFFFSTFEYLSGELILKLFEYFNTKEIVQSFSNLNSFITSCIYDRRQQLHLHLDRQMPSLSDNYSPLQVISLHIEHVVIPNWLIY
jgi:hypothetical protein